MAWLQKTDITLPGNHGKVIPYLHWVTTTKAVVVWISVSEAFPGQIWAMPVAVSPNDGKITYNLDDMHRIGDAHSQAESIQWVEALDGGGYAIHTVTAGS